MRPSAAIVRPAPLRRPAPQAMPLVPEQVASLQLILVLQLVQPAPPSSSLRWPMLAVLQIALHERPHAPPHALQIPSSSLLPVVLQIALHEQPHALQIPSSSLLPVGLQIDSLDRLASHPCSAPFALQFVAKPGRQLQRALSMTRSRAPPHEHTGVGASAPEDGGACGGGDAATGGAGIAGTSVPGGAWTSGGKGDSTPPAAGGAGRSLGLPPVSELIAPPV